jgi:hypothetical protein
VTRLCFIDCETTSLRPDRRAWEVGIIVREPWTVKHPDGPDTVEPRDSEYVCQVHADDLDLGNADLMSLKIGRFHERHIGFGGDPDKATALPEIERLAEVERLTRGAHLVGAVVSFDAEVLAARMRAHGICPSWHYHIICAEGLAAGCLSERARHYEAKGQTETARVLRETATPPWKSDELSAALGVRVSDEERHTALGDAAWAMRIYDAVMGGAS